MKNRLLILLTVAVLAIVGGLAIYTKGFRTIGLTKVEGYKHIEPGKVTCLALMPSCGVCYGKVINKECYVNKSELTNDELQQMELN